MHHVTGTILLVLHTAAFTALLFMPGHTLASPVAMPLPWMTVDYFRDGPTRVQGTRENMNKTTLLVAHNRTQQIKHSGTTLVSSRNSLEVLGSRDSDSCVQAVNHANNLKDIVAQNPPTNENIQQLVNAFQTNSETCQATLLDQLASQKGLAYYDPDDGLETLLKDFINACKIFLDETTVTFCGISILGPVLFSIKCLLEQILDAVENVSDLTLDVTNEILAITDGIGTLLR